MHTDILQQKTQNYLNFSSLYIHYFVSILLQFVKIHSDITSILFGKLWFYMECILENGIASKLSGTYYI